MHSPCNYKNKIGDIFMDFKKLTNSFEMEKNILHNLL